MTLSETLVTIGVTTFAELIKNLAWFILILWGVRVLSKEIGKGVQKIPEWIDQYHRKGLERIRIQEALDSRNK